MTVQIIAPADGALGALVVRHVDLPAPAPDQVRVEVRAAGVNPTDWKSVYGSWPRSAPTTVGFEAAGVVTALGADVAARRLLTVGEEVIVYPVPGGYASDLSVSAGDVFPKPRTLDFAQAANLLLVGTTAAEMLEVAGVRSGETVVVHGASGATGISLLQQVAQLQVRVIATTGERNADLVGSFGAEPVSYGAGLAQRLRDAAPDGIDAALDCVGTDEALEVSVELVADRARVVSIANRDRAQELRIRFLDGREPQSLAYRNGQRRRLVELASVGALTVPVARTLPLTAAEQAFAVLRSGHPGGKLALIP